MKFYIIIIYTIIYSYKSQLCNSFKSCYNCSISKYNCSWYNNKCINFKKNSDRYNSFNTKNLSSYLFFPFINNQYKCINNENDIEFYEEMDNKSIILSKKDNEINEIKYHIYCLKYEFESNIELKFNFNEKDYNNNILELSIYDNMTNSEKKLSKRKYNNIYSK